MSLGTSFYRGYTVNTLQGVLVWLGWKTGKPKTTLASYRTSPVLTMQPALHNQQQTSLPWDSLRQAFPKCNPLGLNINMQILLTATYIFYMTLVGRVCSGSPWKGGGLGDRGQKKKTGGGERGI